MRSCDVRNSTTLLVSPGLRTTVLGTEKSESRTPSPFVTAIPTSAVRPGAWLRFSSNWTRPPSATVYADRAKEIVTSGTSASPIVPVYSRRSPGLSMIPSTGLKNSRVNVSAFSSSLSFRRGTVTVPSVVPGGKVSVPVVDV